MAENIIEILKDTSERYGSSAAICDENASITFSDLYSLGQTIGKWIAAKGVYDKAIGVYAEQIAYTPAIYWGIVSAGCFYVPLDPEAPEEKRNKIIKDCDMPFILCWDAPEEGSFSSSVPCIALKPVIESGDVPDCTLPVLTADSPLYLIYTSGSTGEPKGILKTHGAVMSYIEAYKNEFDFSYNDTLGNQTPFFFDASAKDIYMMLSVGCRIEIIPKKLFAMPVRLIEFLNDNNVTIISWVPSALSVVSKLNTFKTVVPKTLRRVMFVGEVFQKKQLDRWVEACPDVEFVNLYGSSEIAGIACFYRIKGETPETLPMGRSLSNCDVKLVDSEGKVIDKPDISGEIYISSPALAKCYYNNKEKTDGSFVLLDLGDGEARRYFKSGDMAQYNEKGELVFSSRADFQIKHMGHRIELGEIEAAAEELENVVSAACIYQKAREAICLFVQSEDEDSAALAAALRDKLPPYMIPKRYFFIKEMPLTRSGKKDRVALEKEYL